MKNITVCHMENPLGIDINPVFSWIPEVTENFKKQKAYRIIVASKKQFLIDEKGDMWDSKEVESPDFTEICYAGKPLKSKRTYYYKIISYGEESMESSPIKTFHTGLFRNDEWEGSWIGEKSRDVLNLSGANWIGKNNSNQKEIYYQKKINLDKTDIKKIIIGIKANDKAEFILNNQSIGKQSYRYTGEQYDITEAIVQGENKFTIISENSSELNKGIILKAKIEYTDGRISIFVSDETWAMSRCKLDNMKENIESWENVELLGQFGDYPWGDNISLEWEGDRTAIRLRKELFISKEIESAYAYICGLGFFEFSINGNLADDTVLNPFNSQFNQRVLYRTFEITNLLKTGNNALGIELGNGFYNEIGGVWNWSVASWRDNPKVIFNLDILYTDGSKETIVSDGNWRVSNQGPTVSNSMYYGEVYDARKEQKGWNQIDYDDSNWRKAGLMAEPTGELSSQLKEPVKEIASFKPKKIHKVSKDTHIVEGQEMVAGWLQLSNINESIGSEIIITYGQTLDADGRVQRYGGSDGEIAFWWPHGYLQQDKYICNGNKNESFKPKYSYKGHQYIQIDGYSGELTDEDITIYRTSNSIDKISTFESSNPLFNELHQMMNRAMENNFHGDHCDPVLEKIGWTGDANVALSSLMFNFDMRGSLPGWLQVMEDTFKEYNIIPPTAPVADWGIRNHIVWNSLFIYGVEYLEKHFGMSEYVKKQYSIMRRYLLGQIDEIRKNKWIWPDDQLGDWVAPIGGSQAEAQYNEQTSEGSGITGTAMLYGAIGYMKQLAEEFNDSQDILFYEEARQNIYQSFQKNYYDKEKGVYQTNYWEQIGKRTRYRQTDNIVPLAFNLVPNEYISDVVGNLVHDIKNKGSHLDTGCVGTRYILPVLCDFGYPELAYQIANNRTYPSWGYWVENGASSTWEMWEGTTRSYDHYFLGTYDEWFYSHLAGVRNIQKGFEKFTIQPEIIEDLNGVRCEIDTVRGMLSVKWTKRKSNIFLGELVIPFSSEAEIVLPFTTDKIKIEGDDVMNKFVEEKCKYTEQTLTKFVLKTGTYQISCEP